MHLYEVRPRKHKRGVDLISDALLPVLGVVALLVFTSAANEQGKTEELAIRNVIAEFVEAINRSDIKAFGALFTEDADFVVITGKYLKGRSEIVAYHAELFTGDFKASHLDITSMAIRFLR